VPATFYSLGLSVNSLPLRITLRESISAHWAVGDLLNRT